MCKYSVYFRDPRRNAPRIFCCWGSVAIGLTRFLSIDLPLRLMQLCLFSRFACFHMFKTYGCFFIYVPVSPLQLFVPLYRHILKSLLISFITFPGSRRTFEAPPLQILPQEFPPRLSLPFGILSARWTASIFYRDFFEPPPRKPLTVFPIYFAFWSSFSFHLYINTIHLLCQQFF